MSMQREALNVHSGDVAPAGRDGGMLSGWATFGASMLAITAVLNIIYGIGAIGNANFYVHDARFVLSGLNAFGWSLLITGVIQISATVSIFGGTSWGRWVGVASAGLNSIAQLLFIPAAPFLSVTLFAVDIAVIYGLTAGYKRFSAS